MNDDGRGLMSEPVYVLMDAEDACAVCSAAGRPCGGVAVTCGTVRCLPCQGVTWRLGRPWNWAWIRLRYKMRRWPVWPATQN